MRLKSNFIALAIIIMVLSALIPAFGGSVSASTTGWKSNWSDWPHRAPVVITDTSGSSLTDYQVNVVVPYDSDMNSDFSDVRFADSSGNSLYYWLESKTDSTTATFWVKVPSIPASSSATIYLYYGNSGASTTSDIHSTFIWGDDFSNATWTDEHINKWYGADGNASQYVDVASGTYHLEGTYAGNGNEANLSEPIAEIRIPGEPIGDDPDNPENLLAFPANYIVEADVESLDTALIEYYPPGNVTERPTGGAYICARYANVSNKYEQVLQFTWNIAALNKVVGDIWSSLTPPVYLGYEVQASTWYKLTAVVLQGSELGVSVNDVSKISLTADSSLSSTGLAFLGYDASYGFNIAYDNFRVRQYASPEPTVSIGPEQTYGTYTLTYNAGPNGNISGNTTQTVTAGDDGTTVTAVADTGYHFVKWSPDNSTANPRTDTNVTGNITVTANFAIDTFTLTYTAGANGSISGTSTQTVSYGGNGTEVTAVPDTGYHFVKWSDDVMTASRTDTNVTGNITVEASFAIDTFTLTYTAGANGSISGINPQTVNYGDNGSAVSAIPNFGYHFVNWSDSSTANPRTDTNVTSNISVTASFAITLIPGGGGGIILTPTPTPTPRPSPTPTPTPTPSPTPTPIPTPTPTTTPAPAQFVVSNLTVLPSKVSSGENITISADVLNTGAMQGSYAATLKINNSTEAVKNVTLAGGAKATVSFNVTRDAAGTYNVDIGDQTDEFKVSSSAAALGWSAIAGIITSVVILGVAATYLFMRRRGLAN